MRDGGKEMRLEEEEEPSGEKSDFNTQTSEAG